MSQTYSKIDKIPSGQASEKLIEGCLVLEGGAFRGLYTQGFLDAMMQNDLNLSCVIGVSAGALSGLNYVSGQIGRSARINLTSPNRSTRNGSTVPGSGLRRWQPIAFPESPRFLKREGAGNT